jgi:hypothetical protein
MRMLITFLTGLLLSIAGLPGTAAASPASPHHTVQGRGKKKRPRPTKVKKAEKKEDKKKNDRGFEL